MIQAAAALLPQARKLLNSRLVKDHLASDVEAEALKKGSPKAGGVEGVGNNAADSFSQPLKKAGQPGKSFSVAATLSARTSSGAASGTAEVTAEAIPAAALTRAASGE